MIARNYNSKIINDLINEIEMEKNEIITMIEDEIQRIKELQNSLMTDFFNTPENEKNVIYTQHFTLSLEISFLDKIHHKIIML